MKLERRDIFASSDQPFQNCHSSIPGFVYVWSTVVCCISNMNQASIEEWFCDPQFYKTTPLHEQVELHDAIPVEERFHRLEARVYNLEKRLSSIEATMATKSDLLSLATKLDQLESGQLSHLTFFLVMVAYTLIAFWILNKMMNNQEKNLQTVFQYMLKKLENKLEDKITQAIQRLYPQGYTQVPGQTPNSIVTPGNSNNNGGDLERQGNISAQMQTEHTDSQPPQDA